MMLGASSLSLFSLALPSAHTAPSTQFSLPFLCLRRQPSCWSRLAALEYSTELCGSIWGEGSQDITKPTPPEEHTHSLLNIPVLTTPSFSSSHEQHTLEYTASGFKTRRFDLHEVLAYAALHLRSSVSVCVCVKRMLMWVGSWSSGSD